MDEFVTKPIAPKQLFNMLCKWMSQRARTACEPPRKLAPPPPYFSLPEAAGAPLSLVPASPPSPLSPPLAQRRTAPSVPATPAPTPSAPALPVAAPAVHDVEAPAELFDVEALALTFAGKPDKMRKYALLFLTTARESLAEMDEALAMEDLAHLSELGHRTKSAARAVGAMQFGNLCYALEQARHDADTGNAARLIRELHAMLSVLDQHIEQELLAYDPG
jgi:HPt (histidine-containing phosphotransfer) domain-containing protein